MMILGAFQTMAQGLDGLSKSEYRYWNFVLGLNHGFGGAMGDDYAQLMLHTNHGDMKKEKKGFTYTPGIHLGFVYNYDLTTNKAGIVAGIEFSDYGFQNKYKSLVSDDNVKETYRAMAVTVPIMVKFGSTDIYRDMKYAFVGVKANMNLMCAYQQKATWTSEKYGKSMDGNMKKPLSVAATFGFNYNIFNINVNYMFMDFVNSGYVNEEGCTPFNGIGGHIYVCTSLNIPMTRWLCINNWTAEKIRRKLKHHGQ